MFLDVNLKLGGRPGRWLLRAVAKKPSPDDGSRRRGHGPAGAVKMERFFGESVWEKFVGKIVVDYGCGPGLEAVAVAQRGAKRVYGVDVRSAVLEYATKMARAAGVSDRCLFLNARSENVALQRLGGSIECVYSVDAFEHYDHPELILQEIRRLLCPGGSLLVSFGPPWKHPFGSHLRFVSDFPWLHLILREEVLMAVRALYRPDGAERFEEVEGGLNKMTVDRFERLVRGSGFNIEMFRAVPVRGATWLAKNSRLREYLTGVVKCVLVKPGMAPPVCPPARPS